jgi:acyl-CoA dehydrogenase
MGEDVGGAGLDFVAVCLLAEATGRTAAAVPVVDALVAGADVIERFGTAAQRQAWLPGVVAGDTVLTAALAEMAGDLVVPATAAPATTATTDAGGFRIDGVKACVPWGPHADLVLVPAVVDGAGVAVFVVPADAPGLTCTPQEATTGRVEGLLRFDGVAVSGDALLGGRDADGAAVLASLVERTTAALCVEQSGVCEAAVALTAKYTKTREQFDKPIATFQAVGQRAADAYVDAEAIRLTAWQAAWRLSAGLPATTEVATAKFWAAEGGQRAVHAAAHLHGGVGVDRDYPLHRFFLRARVIEHTLGDAGESLRRLGAVLAAEPV